ncbi:MAG: hypothetical protein ACYTFK_11555 [Planctomycetota bacterium]|jgi:hypothetical protein
MSCSYTPSLKAEFGRKISAAEAKEQFQAIEEAMACLENLASSVDSKDSEIHNYGPITVETILSPSYGNLQLLSVEGNVDIEFAQPGESDPRVIYLLIADGGSGSFNLPAGKVWATNANGAITGVPWDTAGLGGEYGAMVVCVHDGIGWMYLVFARNNIDFNAISTVADLYYWR